ncbi:type II secretion system protein [bacterium]|nr:type II secretion system protein [bacterium]
MRKTSGFTLLEVMMATVILSGTLIALSRIISSSYLYTEKISRIYVGTELAWFKLHEIEETLRKDGIPSDEYEEEGEFDDRPFKAFHWKYTIKKVYVPLPDLAPSSDDQGGQQAQAAGMLDMVRGNIEDFFKSRIRKMTLTVWWNGGKRNSEKVVFTKFLDTSGQSFQDTNKSLNPSKSRKKKSNSNKRNRFSPQNNSRFSPQIKRPGGK